MMQPTKSILIILLITCSPISTSNNTTIASSLTNSTNNSISNGTRDKASSSSSYSSSYSHGAAIVMSILTAITSLVTVTGNLLVLISFLIESTLRVASNYFIASLALTDVLIGAFSMSLYTYYLIRGTWPFGRLVCDLWLSLDYTACLTSQYTVLLITLDRFCSVRIPAKYQNWRTSNKVLILLSVTWILPSSIFFTIIIGWPTFFPKNEREKGSCYAEFATNPIFNTIFTVCYFWVTLCLMIGLYVGIYRVAVNLQRRSDEKRNRVNQLIGGPTTGSKVITPKAVASSNASNQTSLLPLSNVGDANGHGSDQGTGKKRLGLFGSGKLKRVNNKDTQPSSSSAVYPGDSSGLDSEEDALKKNTAQNPPPPQPKPIIRIEAANLLDRTENLAELFAPKTKPLVLSQKQRKKSSIVGVVQSSQLDDLLQPSDQEQLVYPLKPEGLSIPSPILSDDETGIVVMPVNNKPICPASINKTITPIPIPADTCVHSDNDDSVAPFLSMDETDAPLFEPKLDDGYQNRVLEAYRKRMAGLKPANNFSRPQEELIKRTNDPSKSSDIDDDDELVDNNIDSSPVWQMQPPTTLYSGSISGSYNDDARSECPICAKSRLHQLGLLQSSSSGADSQVVGPHFDTSGSSDAQSEEDECDDFSYRGGYKLRALWASTRYQLARCFLGVNRCVRRPVTRLIKGTGNGLQKQRGRRANRARKALRTITFILGAFLLCWTPYHIVIIIKGICDTKKGESCINDYLYSVTNWLCYMNSPINPFCYALVNAQFKTTFLRILHLDLRRR